MSQLFLSWLHWYFTIFNLPGKNYLPSKSLLLGAPIAFSNLGTPITELFQVGEYQILSVAYRQILKYLQTYAAEAKSAFSMEDFSPSKSDLESAETIRSFLESVRQKCRHLWAEFDIFTMTVGACLVRV